MSLQDKIRQAISVVERQFGKGALMSMSDEANQSVETYSTGSLALNRALGMGGIPRGRIVEVYGPESSGKTTLALHIIAEAQKKGTIAAFIDAEHALDVAYAKRLGVKVDELLVSQPDNGEQALNIATALTPLEDVGLIVVDSVAALVPKAEIEGEMGDQHVGLQARLMSQALRKLAAVSNRNDTTIVFINQIRHKIGVMFGSPETTTGGNALKFYASLRIEVRRGAVMKNGDENVGCKMKMKVVKNKLAPPFQRAEVDLMFGKGIYRQGEILDLGVESGVLSKSGSWYSYGETRLGQGRDKAAEYLNENPQLSNEIEEQLTPDEKAEAAG